MAQQPSRHNKWWTVDEDKAVAEFIKKRMDVATIARMMGRTDAAIRARLFQHVSEKTIADIAHITNMTISGIIYKTASNTGEPWCTEQDSWLVRHIQKNTIMDSAIRMKRTESEIRDRLHYIARSYVKNAGFPLVCAAAGHARHSSIIDIINISYTDQFFLSFWPQRRPMPFK